MVSYLLVTASTKTGGGGGNAGLVGLGGIFPGDDGWGFGFVLGLPCDFIGFGTLIFVGVPTNAGFGNSIGSGAISGVDPVADVAVGDGWVSFATAGISESTVVERRLSNSSVRAELSRLADSLSPARMVAPCPAIPLADPVFDLYWSPPGPLS